jgi:hypothetical protein
MRTLIEWGIVIVCSLAAIVAVSLAPLSPADGALPTLLSSISIGLAVLFAVIFGITLLVPLLFPFHLDKTIKGTISNWTILYMLLFIIAIILPWGALFSPNGISIRVSVVLAVVSLVLLIPYFESVVKKVKSDYIFEILCKGAITALEKDPQHSPEAIVSMDNIIMKAFNDHDFETFRKGVKAIAGIPLEFKNRMDIDSKEITVLSKTVFDHFVKIKIRFMDRTDLLDVFNWAELWAQEALHGARHEQEIGSVIKRGMEDFQIEKMMSKFDKDALGQEVFTGAKDWITGTHYLKCLLEKRDGIDRGIIVGVLDELKEENGIDPDIVKTSHDTAASKVADYFPEYLNVFRQFKRLADAYM